MSKQAKKTKRLTGGSTASSEATGGSTSWARTRKKFKILQDDSETDEDAAMVASPSFDLSDFLDDDRKQRMKKFIEAQKARDFDSESEDETSPPGSIEFYEPPKGSGTAAGDTEAGNNSSSAPTDISSSTENDTENLKAPVPVLGPQAQRRRSFRSILPRGRLPPELRKPLVPPKKKRKEENGHPTVADDPAPSGEHARSNLISSTPIRPGQLNETIGFSPVPAVSKHSSRNLILTQKSQKPPQPNQNIGSYSSQTPLSLRTVPVTHNTSSSSNDKHSETVYEPPQPNHGVGSHSSQITVPVQTAPVAHSTSGTRNKNNSETVYEPAQPNHVGSQSSTGPSFIQRRSSRPSVSSSQGTSHSRTDVRQSIHHTTPKSKRESRKRDKTPETVVGNDEVPQDVDPARNVTTGSTNDKHSETVYEPPQPNQGVGSHSSQIPVPVQNAPVVHSTSCTRNKNNSETDETVYEPAQANQDVGSGFQSSTAPSLIHHRSSRPSVSSSQETSHSKTDVRQSIHQATPKSKRESRKREKTPETVVEVPPDVDPARSVTIGSTNDKHSETVNEPPQPNHGLGSHSSQIPVPVQTAPVAHSASGTRNENNSEAVYEPAQPNQVVGSQSSTGPSFIQRRSSRPSVSSSQGTSHSRTDVRQSIHHTTPKAKRESRKREKTPETVVDNNVVPPDVEPARSVAVRSTNDKHSETVHEPPQPNQDLGSQSSTEPSFIQRRPSVSSSQGTSHFRTDVREPIHQATSKSKQQSRKKEQTPETVVGNDIIPPDVEPARSVAVRSTNDKHSETVHEPPQPNHGVGSHSSQIPVPVQIAPVAHSILGTRSENNSEAVYEPAQPNQVVGSQSSTAPSFIQRRSSRPSVSSSQGTSHSRTDVREPIHQATSKSKRQSREKEKTPETVVANDEVPPDVNPARSVTGEKASTTRKKTNAARRKKTVVAEANESPTRTTSTHKSPDTLSTATAPVTHSTFGSTNDKHSETIYEPSQPNQGLGSQSSIAPSFSQRSNRPAVSSSQGTSHSRNDRRRSIFQMAREKASKSKQHQSRKRTKTPERYVGNDVFGNYHMLKEADVRRIFQEEQPGVDIDDETMKKYALKINHYLEDFFVYHCEETKHPFGFIPFKMLLGGLKGQDLLPKNATDEDLLKTMKEAMPLDDWKRSEGIIIPSRYSKSSDTADYFYK